ncbi:efflux RND transporter periplasmic adaptor subunit [Pseudobutyrivibrio xylanivorans]|uniref:Multidrug efflux pump subunit AcrA (Membrane-fusion protein) n=1 Tax=Pseudobutyrivibrio xylanivorans DSM 14809 TaxID=1123012 RepID=A0A1M6DZV0_PSEXY|nr:efflux RND transporter periplasmic adaptor subunit [Pseudobutyrivibrio xylanivorans]SHI78663.1 Multidrug efflux pump subunit AcrA (membrane-fusion protein) [Pseudobutyrivibrio xylanivorans DSM 14809]
MGTVKKVFGKIGRFLKKHIKLIIILVIVLAVVLFVRYRVKQAQAILEEQANQPVTATVDQMDLQKSVSVTGTLTATETAKVTSTIGGTMTGIKVKKINYEVGDYVEAGSVVVEFDGDDFDRKITELNAQYNIENKQSAQDISDLQKTITDTQKKIDERKEWLEKYRVYYDAVKLHFENGQKDPYSGESEKYEEQNGVIKARYGFTIEEYEAKEDELETWEDSIEKAQMQIELAQLKQQFSQNYTQVDAKEDVYESKDATHVSAPISGYIITMNVTEGNNYAQGNTVFTIADTSGFVVEATVNEYDIAKIENGLPAKVKFEATEDETFDGEVTFVSLASESAIGANQGQTGSSVPSYKVKIKMNDNDSRMRVGMTAKASVILDSVKNAICVPYDCVQKNEKDGTFFVTTIDDDGKKKDITVTKGLESDYYVEVKGDGLKKGMTVEAIVDDGPSTDVMDYIYFE